MSDNTQKRQVVVGHETYLNQRTGELVECEIISVEDRDFNFDKIWAFWLAQALDLLGGAKIQVLTYLLEHRDGNNRVISTQRNMAEKIGVSTGTVSSTLVSLQEIGAIKSPQSGVYVINPNFIFRGSHSKRLRVMMEYSKMDSSTSSVPHFEESAAE